MADTVYFSGTRADLRRFFADFGRTLATTGSDPSSLAHGLQLRMGVGLLACVQRDFAKKASGQTGEDGITWPKLKRSTIAQRRTTAGERKSLGIGGKRVRGLLTPKQDKRWRAIFAQRKAMFQAKFGLGDKESSARAAQIAWTILKAEGAKTKLDVLGGRYVEILRDTGELFRSFSPGVDDQPSGADGQIFRTLPDRVMVGTNKKTWHHSGIPGKLPARPFWRPDGSLPDAWWQIILGLGVSGLARALALVLGGRKIP